MGIDDGYVGQLPDIDPAETQEWLESLDAVAAQRGDNRAEFILQKLLNRAHHHLALDVPGLVQSPYINSIAPAQQETDHWFPGDFEAERRIRAFIRWNAAVMVVKANKASDGIGGHLATFASSAALYEVGFNWFFRGKDDGTAGDAVYFQGHASPGIYARSYLEGRLDEADLDGFRREIGGGLSSYPHPRLMPEYWEYPTVSMGLGPINSLYQARFNRYLHHRQLSDTSASRVWGFIGDGECDEPETLGAISLAGREGLDNLTWVINCNLQRLDGPVRGNGKIIQELESVFRGAGWNVIKVIWGTAWDDLLAKDVDGVLLDKMNATLDGDFQRYAVADGAYIREHFFGPDPRLREMVAHLSDEELRWLPRGGHDYRKLYAAYQAATQHRGQPTVILAKTVKGWTLGSEVEARNATHQIKKMSNEQFLALRARLHMEEEIPDEALADGKQPPYYRPPAGSELHTYLMDRRRALGGALPSRHADRAKPVTQPADSVWTEFLGGSGTQAASTTTAFTRMLRALARDEGVGSKIVPIIPDEARTFGMDSLFKEFGIYAAQGQKYEPVDHDMLLTYKESITGQILEEGITEAGAMASWTAAATSYATRGVATIPFFTFYSMFGFQRVGDLIWAAADIRARGFLMAATAGRTTLEGEGLQHADGHSLVLASVVPTCRAYDPAFAYETAVIVRHGIDHMYGSEPEDVFYYLTLYNENYPMPAMPDGVTDGIIEGLYRWAAAPDAVDGPRATLLFSGSAQGAARDAQTELAERWNVGLELWSATSYKALREEAMAVERWNRLHPGDEPRTARVTELLSESSGPIVAVTDFMRAVPDQISRWVPSGRAWTSLGTDGFGRSDNRQTMRRYFENDAASIVVSVLAGLATDGAIDVAIVQTAIDHYELEVDGPVPWHG